MTVPLLAPDADRSSRSASAPAPSSTLALAAGASLVDPAAYIAAVLPEAP